MLMEIVDAVRATTSIRAGADLIERAGHAMGMPRVGCAHDISRVRGPTDEHGVDLSIGWGWPQDFADDWAEQHLTFHTPFFVRCRYAALPFVWNADSLASTGASRRERLIAQKLKAEGYVEAIVVPVHLPFGRIAAVTWWGDRTAEEAQKLTIEQGPQLLALSHYFIHLLDDQVMPARNVEMPPPSVREIECLTFASKGLSDAEIAYEMQISAHTVRYLINSVSRRLQARNRTHAVALASQLGVIGVANQRRCRSAR